jgi:lysyl-tRNA synthetase class I
VRSIPFRFAAIVVQLVPEERMEERALDLLRRTGHLAGEVAEEERARVRERLSQAKEWVGRHAPPEVRISLLPEVGAEVKASLAPEVRSALADVAAALADEAVTEEALNRAVFDAARAHGISSGQMFTACYRVLLGTKGGPRLAPFLLTLDRAFVRRRLAELA